MNKEKMLKRVLPLVVFVALAIFAYDVYAQAMGCCTNPNALLPCYSDMTYVGDCCPEDDQSFYSNETGYGPYDHEDCVLNYFFEGTSCEDIADCEVGCCCPSFGSPSLPEYAFKATCVAPNYYFVGNINLSQNCTTICKVTPPPEINVSACEYLEPQNLAAVHVKGSNSVWLDWSDECNATYFSVARCHGTRPECSQADFSILSSYVAKTYYTDGDRELLWSISDTDKEVYTYMVTAHYSDQTHSSYVSLTRGDLECWEKYDNNAFCIHMQNPYNVDPVKSYLIRLLDPLNLTQFDQEIIRLFGIRFNKGYYCDDNNFLHMVKGCGDERYRVCTADQGIVQCKDRTDCRRVGDPFNMNSILGSCEEDNYCFFDRSRTNVDACYDCSPEMVCYDYKTQGACERDNCGLGNCEWRPIQIQGASQLNLGVCVDTQGYNCKFCLEPRGTPGVESNEAYNYVFDKCTEEKMAALSTERYNCSQELSLCRERTCLNYTTGDECNKNGFLRRDNATNEMIVKGEDFCGIDVCNWRHNKCVKDADADEIPDCVYAGNELACEMDYFPPQTSLSWDDSVLSIQILDRLSFGGELIDASSNNNYKVYLCRYTGSGTCRIAPDDYQEFNGPVITRQTLVSRGLIRSGENTIKYFSRDAYKNLEIVKSTFIKANPIVPFVLITSPSDGTTTWMRTIVVKGVVQDWGVVDSASLLVNGNPIPINIVQGAFSKTINLEEGVTVLQAKVVTIEGVTSKSYPVRVTYKYVDPAITYIEPVPDSYMPTTSITLKLSTNREGTCLYGTTQPPSIHTGTFGTFTTEHTSAELKLSLGNHTYYFKCDFLNKEGNTISVYAKTSFFIDVTKPTTPIVDDSSNIPGLNPQYTYYTDRLYAKWYATDPESGIAAYNYSVYRISGTAEISVLGWTTTDQTSKWIMGLNLNNGIKYYVKAKAQNNAGTWGGEGSSDGVIVNTSMLPDQCRDGVKTGSETDVDCGGVQCPGCDNGKSCVLDMDCFSGFCNESKICSTPTCNDYEKNQDETDVDCGGAICRRCGEDEACILNSDCEQPELICKDHVCSRRIKPYCGDGDITAPEQCDGSNWGSITGCKNFDFTGGTLTCGENCIFNTSQCKGPLPAMCGDAVIQPGEQCDGSNWGGIKGCWNFDNFTEGQLTCTACTFNTSNCSRPPERICGDNIIQPGEQCDGKNWGTITGCKNFDNFTGGTLRCIDCELNTDQCTGMIGGFCGDGKVQVGEQCDGPFVEDCTYFDYFIGGKLRCLNCTFNTELCTPPREKICGNGVIEPGEQCDKGNWDGVSGCEDFGFTGGILSCKDDCKFNFTKCIQLPVCGNSVIEPGEQCDGDDWGNINDCTDFDNFTGGTLRCIKCEFNTSQCAGLPPGECGDRIIQRNEQCDKDNWGAITSCKNFDEFTGGELFCHNCSFNTSKCTPPLGYCGDRIVQVHNGEQCDRTNFGSVSGCEDFGYDAGTLTCDENCTFNTNQCKYVLCGNGKIDSGETCDGDDWGNISGCEDFGNFTKGNLQCIGCRFNTDQCDGGIVGYCGDGIVQVGEQCDKNSWGNIKDCKDFDYDSGNITCNTNCTFNTSKCKKEGTEYEEKCSNGKLNFGETDVDCGGVCIAKGKLCGLGDACEFNSDCESEYCTQGKCAQRLGVCKSGEVTDCMIGLCDGTKSCVNGAWSDCVKTDTGCDTETGTVVEKKKGMPQILKIFIWLLIIIVLAVIGYFGFMYYQQKKKPPTPPKMKPAFGPVMPPKPFGRFKEEEERMKRVEAMRGRFRVDRRGVKEAERKELFKAFEVPKKEEVKVPGKEEVKALKKEEAVEKKPEKIEKEKPEKLGKGKPKKVKPAKRFGKEKPEKMEKEGEDIFKKLRKETKELRKATKKRIKK